MSGEDNRALVAATILARLLPADATAEEAAERWVALCAELEAAE